MKLRKYSHLSRLCTLTLLTAAGLGTGCTVDSLEAEDVAAAEDALWLQGTRWPSKDIQNICWTAESVALENFATLSQRFDQALFRTWTQASGLVFRNNGQACSTAPNATNGWMEVHLREGGGGLADVGYAAHRPRNVALGRDDSDFDMIVMHEVAHVLGFAHEMRNPGFVDDPSGSCAESNVSGNGVGTLPDRDSITAARYCETVSTLSYWDTVGAQNSYGQPTRFADMNGDGKDDVIVIDPNTPRIRWRLSTGSAFEPTERTSSVHPGTKGTFFADVTGDRKADLVRVEDDGIHVRPSKGTSLDADTRWTSGPWLAERALFITDVTGDGKADLVGIDSGSVAVRPSNGASFPGPSRAWLSNPPRGRYGTFFADVTGDGATDFVVVTNDGFRVHKSNRSNGFSAAVTWGERGWRGDRGTFLVDVDNDKDADLVAIDENGVTVRRSTGSAFSTTAEAWSLVSAYRDRGVAMADVDGDGRSDVMGMATTLIQARRSTGTKFAGAQVFLNTPFFSGQIPTL